ncbi:hypothetical protein PR048_007676 [Dryococelus australis]|uniref:HTH CENPB-type domain-containing protein n=1 Tax=Dryococelus australis TaxID=614101 RepID=A0ABQ9HVS8_9NEOP|nr:hypothetical protein PR048_007676 [Dryococelus australis]
MVRNYKRKTKRGLQYTQDNIQEAKLEINAGHCNIYSPSKRFKIPYTTLLYKLKGVRAVKNRSQGKATSIPEEAEKRLAECIKTMDKWGFGITRREMLELVGSYVQRNKSDTSFKDGTPGEDWLLDFKKRHNLSIIKPQAVEYARKSVLAPFVINHYFDVPEKVLSDNDIEDKSHNIYHLDETSFCTDPSKSKVVGEKNSPSTRINGWHHQRRDSQIHPMLQQRMVGLKLMSSTTTKNAFIPHALHEGPILLLYGGHTTHVDNRVIYLAIENKIIIVKLPPHTSHLLQLLDLSTFKQLKEDWDAKLVAWQRQHIGVRLPKRTFSALMDTA